MWKISTSDKHCSWSGVVGRLYLQCGWNLLQAACEPPVAEQAPLFCIEGHPKPVTSAYVSEITTYYMKTLSDPCGMKRVNRYSCL